MNNHNNSPFGSSEPTPREQRNTCYLAIIVVIIVVIFFIVFA